MLPSRRMNEIGKLGNAFEYIFGTEFPFLVNSEIKITVNEESENYDVKAELPGVKKEDIQIDFKEERLTIKATKEESKEIKEENYLYKEISNGEIARTIYLPGAVAEKIEAEYKNGILNLIVPKKEITENENKIDIEIK